MAAQAFEGFMRCQVTLISADSFFIATGRFSHHRSL
ncbi:unknown [Eggerthella sp. CAG:209]|nr:unknown [Eggerthella sp. CAG:209]